MHINIRSLYFRKKKNILEVYKNIGCETSSFIYDIWAATFGLWTRYAIIPWTRLIKPNKVGFFGGAIFQIA